MKRCFSVVLAVVVALLAGCKEPEGAGQIGQSVAISAANPDVVVKSVNVYQNPDNTPSFPLVYVVKFTYTNHLGYDLLPDIAHFIFEDNVKDRFPGMDTGSTVLVGISNDKSILKNGDSRDFTVGFRVPSGSTGTLFYDPVSS